MSALIVTGTQLRYFSNLRETVVPGTLTKIGIPKKFAIVIINNEVSQPMVFFFAFDKSRFGFLSHLKGLYTVPS